MNTSFSTRGSLLALITGLHLAVLWVLVVRLMQPSIEPPVPYPVVMAEMLPLQKSMQQQRSPEPPPLPKSVHKPEPVKPAKPVIQKSPAPVPTPTPNTTPSEQAISVPQPPQAAPASVSNASSESSSSTASTAAASGSAPVTAPRFDAAYLNNPWPPYPSLAKRMGEQGRVLLRVHVTAEGKPDEVQLQTSSGSSLLDDSALQTVRDRWKFVPARQNGNAVAAWVKVPIDFKFN